jgi:hypothetical protein
LTVSLTGATSGVARIVRLLRNGVASYAPKRHPKRALWGRRLRRAVSVGPNVFP